MNLINLDVEYHYKKEVAEQKKDSYKKLIHSKKPNLIERDDARNWIFFSVFLASQDIMWFTRWKAQRNNISWKNWENWFISIYVASFSETNCNLGYWAKFDLKKHKIKKPFLTEKTPIKASWKKKWKKCLH